MNVVKEIQRINERELELGIGGSASWHAKYKDSAYVFLGGLDFGLSEGDLICVMSQFGEVVDCNLIRDKDTGKSRGFAFVAFEDQRSTVLAIDNLCGAKVMGRTLRVDHADRYRRPKRSKEEREREPDKSDETWEEESKEEYDKRRRAIWDYEAYGAHPAARRENVVEDSANAIDAATVAAIAAASGGAVVVTAPPSSSSAAASGGAGGAGGFAAPAPRAKGENEKHTDRVMALLAERKKQRSDAKKADAMGIPQHMRTPTPAAASAMGSATAAGGTTQFGDQLIGLAAPAASSSASAGDAAKNKVKKEKKKHKTKHKHKKDKRSRSRSRSHSRAHSHSRSRSPPTSQTPAAATATTNTATATGSGSGGGRHRSRSRSRDRDRDRERRRHSSRSRSRSRSRDGDRRR